MSTFLSLNIQSPRIAAALVYFIICLALLSAACGNLPGTRENASGSDSANTAPESKARTTSPESGQSAESAGICINEYYPVALEKTRNYKITGTAGADYSLSQAMNGVDRFTETRKFDSGLSVVTNWQCTEDGLRYVEYNSLITMPNAQITMDTVRSEGITLPREWEVGSEWTTLYEINMKMPNQNMPASGTVTILNKLVSLNDQIKTEGGEFTAARVDSKIRIDLNVKGMKVPSTETKISNWYAPEVGLVKQGVTGTFGEQRVEFIGDSK